ncbi:DNA-directed RNA polymerase, mitochondrial isoform X5 [Tyto alba]|uniref:DNA-directed RNA polymerase, mitochondrial isoform X5 n=1 Tax=Tyto alba TaxID=56313 RepID=UPI001C6703DC|nr:DNA-directed RNA polymerase, mitochondrial isoform X5 [Tyto alba]
MALPRMQAALLGPARLRGAGIPWSVLRNYSSASTKEKASRNAISERTELLEVLKARVKQLQASNVPEVTINKVELAPLVNDKYQDPLQKAVAPSPAEEQPTPRGSDESPARPSSWVKKMKKEAYLQQLKVEQKLPSTAFMLALEVKVKAKRKGKSKAKRKGEAKAKPEGEVKAKPEGKVKAKPEGEVKAKPEGEAKAKPEGEAKAKPEGEAKAKPEGKVKAKPEGEVKAKPEGEAKAKPEGEAKAKPEGEAKAKPEGEVKAKPEGKVKAKPEGEVKAKPEGKVKAKRKGEAKAKPEGKVKAKPEGEAKAKPEGEAKAKPEGEAKAKPEGEVKAKPEGKAKAKPEGEAKAKPEGEAKAKPEGEVKAKPEGEVKVKAKAKKSLKSPKAEVAVACSQSHAGSRSVYSHIKPRMAAVKGGAKVQRPWKVLEGKDSSQHKILQQTIQSNLECFLFLQQPEEAERFLLLYHSSPAKRKFLNVNAYNIVMHSWARKGSLQHIYQLFSMLEAAGLRPSLDSYAALLECMGRNQVSPKAIRRCVKQLKNDGFHVDDLFQKCLFEEDEKEKVLRAIRTVQPKYKLPPPPRPKICKSSLLRDFYSKKTTVSYPNLDFSVQELQERFQQQLEMELDNTVTIQSVESTKPLTPQAIKARKLLATLRSKWHNSILRALQKSKHNMSKPRTASAYNTLYPYLCVLPDKEYVGIMLQILNTISPHGEFLSVLARELGSKVYNKYIIQRKLRSRQLEKVQEIYKDYVHLLANDSQPDKYLPREYWEKLVAKAGFGPSLNLKDGSWPCVLIMRLGMHLLEILVQTVKVPRNTFNTRLEPRLIPVLYHIYSYRSTWQVGLIKPHPIFSHIMSDAAETMLTFNSSAIPMLCPPVPWTSPHFGAFLLSDTKFMRIVDGAIQHQLLLDQCPPVNLHPVLDALNQLGNCAWKINQPVLDIIISIFNDKGNEKLDIPPPISEAPRPPAAPSNSSASSKAHKHELLLCKKKTAEMHSLRMDALYKLSIANYVRDKVFWFPHNMDFRGRTYPCPPYFNHLGNDVTRAILLFAEGRPLGPKGLDWLKIHLINLTGLKKKNSLQERLEFANEIMEEILDSADHPLTGRKWWMNTDEPWQALACCMEIAKASRSPDPAAYISHFPVHQDGSCNGLQHYAALGRDLIGAMSVNLMPCNVPQDVYSVVAQQVEEFRKKDAEQGVKIAQVLQGFITRKVVKQTVMTVVYGVTRYGGRLQMEKRLKEIEEFPEEYLWEASHYLVKQVFSGIKEMFSATRDIQTWLTESAKLIAQSGRTVEWVTPLGLPIMQPYYRSKSTVLNCSMQTLSVKTSNNNQKPDTVKQKNAFPPNFIHSLDSTHMMLTALHCLRQGLTFVSVHDCYWTHALTVDIMNQICRQQFVALHSEKILQDLSKFMLEKYCSPGRETRALWQKKLMEQLSNVPKTGKFNLKEVINSTYFFS